MGPGGNFIVLGMHTLYIHYIYCIYGIGGRRWPFHAYTIGRNFFYWDTPLGEGGKGTFFGGGREKSNTKKFPFHFFIDVKPVPTRVRHLFLFLTIFITIFNFRFLRL